MRTLGIAATAAFVTAGCGGPPLTTHASLVVIDTDQSTLDATAETDLHGSIAPRPEIGPVGHRLHLLAQGLSGVSSREAHDLLESNIAWAEVLYRGGWLEPSRHCTPTALDLPIVVERLAGLAQPTAQPCLQTALAIAAIRGTRGALEREAASRHVTDAWTAAMVEMRGIVDDCPRDGSELSAIAAAVRHHGDVVPGATVRASTPLGGCRVATLAGQSEILEALGEPFATSCWIHGGVHDRACGAVETLGAEMDVLDSSFEVPGDPSAPVVYVEIGAANQAHVYIVAQVHNEWRVVQGWLGWSR